MKIDRQFVQKTFTRKRLVILAVTKATVSTVGVIAWRVHFVSELLAAEVLFALLFFAVAGIAVSLYLIGTAAVSIGAHLKATLKSLPDFHHRLRVFQNDIAAGHHGLISIATAYRLKAVDANEGRHVSSARRGERIWRLPWSS